MTIGCLLKKSVLLTVQYLIAIYCQNARLIYDDYSLKKCATVVQNNAGNHARDNVNNEENVIDVVPDNPTLSTRRISIQLHLSQNFVWRALHLEELQPEDVWSFATGCYIKLPNI